MNTPFLSLLAAAVLFLPLSPAVPQQAPTVVSQSNALRLPEYRSAFSEYRPFRDESIADWRASNDEVARIGGHIGIVGGASHAAHGAGKPPSAAPAGAQAPGRSEPGAPASRHKEHH